MCHKFFVLCRYGGNLFNAFYFENAFFLRPTKGVETLLQQTRRRPASGSKAIQETRMTAVEPVKVNAAVGGKDLSANLLKLALTIMP